MGSLCIFRFQFAALLSVCLGQADQVVKNIHEVNDDGSYTIGYETKNGEFKLETKDKEGNVRGELIL